MLPDCFTDVVRTRLLEYLKVNDGVWRVLVVDNFGLNVIASCLTNTDLHGVGITITERLSLGRQPIPDKPAIYFCQPTIEAANHIIEDWTTADAQAQLAPRIQYSRAHIRFTSRTPDNVLAMLRSSTPLVRSVASYLDCYCEVYIVEMSGAVAKPFQGAPSFSEPPPPPLLACFPRAEGESATPARTVQIAATSAAARLCDIALTLRVMPKIRYSTTGAATAAAHEAAKELAALRDGIAARGVPWRWNCAESLSRTSDLLGRGEGGGGASGGASAAQSTGANSGEAASPHPVEATFVIVDRSFDPISPLLCDFGVYALAVDSLPSPSPSANKFRISDESVLGTLDGNRSGDGPSLKSPMVAGSEASGASSTTSPPKKGKGKDAKASSSVDGGAAASGGGAKDFAFDMQDPLTRELRGVHIARAGALLEERRAAFVARNAAAAAVLEHGDVRNAPKEAVGKVAASLPQYVEVKQRITDHLNLIKALTTIYTQRGMIELSRLEQRLASGVEASGEAVAAEGVVQNAEQMLRDHPRLRESELARLRLVAVAAASVPAWGATVKDDALKAALVQRVVNAANSSRAAAVSTAITRLLKSAPVDSGSSGGGFLSMLMSKKSSDTRGRSRFFGGGGASATDKNKERQEGALLDARGSPYDTARYVPAMRHVIEAALSKSLPAKTFGETSPVANVGAVAGVSSTQPRSGVSLRTVRSRTSSAAHQGIGIDSVRLGPPQIVVVYVIGGVCASEVREATSACTSSSLVVACGDEFLNPDAMVSGLVRAGGAAGQ